LRSVRTMDGPTRMRRVEAALIQLHWDDAGQKLTPRERARGRALTLRWSRLWGLGEPFRFAFGGSGETVFSS
jgi:hypothetical protein